MEMLFGSPSFIEGVQAEIDTHSNPVELAALRQRVIELEGWKVSTERTVASLLPRRHRLEKRERLLAKRQANLGSRIAEVNAREEALSDRTSLEEENAELNGAREAALLVSYCHRRRRCSKCIHVDRVPNSQASV